MTNTTEKWVDIVGYEGRYSISNLGRVMSHHQGKNRILKSVANSTGYAYVDLSRNNISKSFRVHVLVAKHFLPNPQGLTDLNHKDENKLNNRLDNLEWCTKSYNINYGTRNARQRVKMCKPVVQYYKNGERIRTYDSVRQASQITDISAPHIVMSCKKTRPSAGGFVWKYLSEVQDAYE